MSTLMVRFGRSQNLRLTLGVLVGLTFGRLMSLIPSPHEYNVFWVGNLCAPWLLIAFCTGLSQRSAPRAAIAGLLAESACVVGFYSSFLFHGPTALGLPRDTPLSQYLLPAVTGWLHFISFWLVIAVGSGTVYGLLGLLWRRSAHLITGLAIGLPFVAEPGLWTLRDHQLKGPLGLWAIEVSFGLALAGMVMTKSFRVRAGLPGPPEGGRGSSSSV